MAIFTQSFRLTAANTSSNKTSIMDNISNTSNEYYTYVNTTDTSITEIGQFVCYLDPTRFTDQQGSTSIKSISIEFESKKIDASIVSSSNTRFVFWGAEGGGVISYPTSTTFSLSSLDYWTSSYNTTKDGPYWQTGGVPTSEYQTYKIKLFENTILPRSVTQLNNWGIVIGIGYTDNSTVQGNVYLRNLWVKVEYEATEYKANVVAFPDSTAGTVSRILHTKGGSTTYGWLTNGYYYNVERNSILTLRASPSTNYYIDSWDKDGKILNYGNSDCEVTIDTNNATYYANFAKYQYTVNTSASNGSLTGGGTFDTGSYVTLTATPDYGYKCEYIYQVDSSGNVIGIVASNNGNSNSQLIYSFTLGNTNVYYRASFVEDTFTITYHSNGGSYFETLTDTHIVGSTVQLSPRTGTVGRLPETENGYIITIKSNGSSHNDKYLTAINTRTYTIGDWNTKADGTGIYYIFDSEYSDGISLELYMIWNSYIFPSDYGQIKFPTVDEYIRDGYTLLGFSTNQNATSATYSPGASIQPSSNTTYYAIWEKTISISYDINGGVGTLPDPPSSKTIYNTTTNASFNLTTSNLSISKEGHTFGGWSQTKGGTTAVGSSITVSDDTTLYAIWKVNQYTITPKLYTIDLNGNITEDNSGGYLYFEDGTQLSSTKSFNYGDTIIIYASPYSGYAFSKWGDINSAFNSREITIPAYNIELSAYFIVKNKVLTIKHNSSSLDSDVIIWMREKNGTNYGEWIEIPYNSEYSFSQNAIVQITAEHGENYEFAQAIANQVGLPMVGLDPYFDYQITGQTTFTVYSNKREVINKIWVGNKLQTNGYVNNPNLSFKEEISSIWIGSQQIMGKKPIEYYPYIIDTLLEDTLYINNQNAILNKSYQNNTSIKKIIIPKNITTIGANYLRSCTNLETIKFLQNSQLTSLGNYAFAEDNSLLKVYLPDKLQNIGEGAFQQCTKLQKVVLPASVSTIQQYAFYNCVNLQSLKLNHTKITELPYSVFMYCSNLKTVFLPKTLTSIGARAFYQCNSLEKIIYMGTIEDWNKITIPAHGNTYLNRVPIQCIDGITYTNLE